MVPHYELYLLPPSAFADIQSPPLPLWLEACLGAAVSVVLIVAAAVG
jgi:hypothetical protein